MESGLKNNLTPKAPLAVTESSSGKLDVDSFCLYFASFPDPVLVTDSRRRVVFINRAAEALIGCSLDKVDTPPVSQLFHTEISGKKDCFFNQCLKGKNVQCMPVRIRSRDGKWISLSVTATVIRGKSCKPIGCLAVMRDIKMELAAQPEIQHKLAMLSSILENFPIPFFTVDPDLQITSMSRTFEKLSGYTRPETLQRLSCADVLASPDCNTDRCPMQKAMDTRQPVSGIRKILVDRKGRKIPIIVNASVITDSDDNIIGGFEVIRDITPVVEAEEKIQLLTEMTQEGILMVDGSHRIIFANSKMSVVSGHSKEELIGMDVRKILSPEQHRILTELMQTFDRDQTQQLSFCTMIEPISTPREGQCSFETCMAVTCVGKSTIACLYFRDITGRIEIERQLRNANSFLENIIRSSVDGIIVMDTEGKVLIFNEGAERILGYNPEEVIGHSDTIYYSYNPELARENMRKMRSNRYGPPGKLNPTHITLRAKGGEEVPVNFSAAIIQEGDQEIGSVGIFSDEREHLKIRKQLEEARIQLLQAEKIASLGRLAAGVAHEINNPLAGILIYADMLMRELKENPQWRQDLQEVIDQTLRCKEIVTRLLEFSRLPLGQRVFFDINDLINRCVGLLGHQTLFHDIEFKLGLQPDLPMIVGDPGQIQQVFTNIIINAADAMSGKGELRLSSIFDKSSERVILTFVDTGPGIPLDIMDKIFEPFFTTKLPGEGTGLGLSVVYGIVQQHGGTIMAESEPEGGTRFTITLPLEAPEIMIETIEE